MEPTDTKAEKPTLLALAQSSTAVPRAPDWLMKATRPASGTVSANVALTLQLGRT